jgi:IS5 family transposase
VRLTFSRQQRLDCQAVSMIDLNLNCRHEIIPILRTLQHVYETPKLRDEILDLIAQDVNRNSRDDCGRPGLSYWQILVLAGVRLGCNLDLDALQDLAEQHGNLRHMMSVGDWDGKTSFDHKRIQANLSLLRPETIEKISHAIVAEGHRMNPEAPKKVRADSFVVETDIHWPTESSLIRDGIRKAVELAIVLAATFSLAGWRQGPHLITQVKRLAANIDRISSRKGAHSKTRLKKAYGKLLKSSERVLRKLRKLAEEVESNEHASVGSLCQVNQLRTLITQVEQVRDVARRRVLRGEKDIPNMEKLFSIFEPHTQLYKRGKTGVPIQFGRLVLVYEDAVGFVIHHHVMPRDAQDVTVAVEQTRVVQERLAYRIESLSFDCGFHSPENQQELAKLVSKLCLPTRGVHQVAAQKAEADEDFRQSRKRHPGVESAVGALQSGNGLERCRDHSETGFERYVAMGVLGRNLHVLGKLLIAQEDDKSEAAFSARSAA